MAVIQQLMGGLRSSMGYAGCGTIGEMRERTEFVEITAAGVRESHVHDVQIVKEAPNYRVDSFFIVPKAERRGAEALRTRSRSWG